MPLQQLNEHETKFFESQGSEVHESLREGLPDPKSAGIEPKVEPKVEVNVEQKEGVEKAVPDKKAAGEDVTPITELKTESSEVKLEVEAEAKRNTERQRLIKEMGLVPLEALQEARAESKQIKEQMRQYEEFQRQVAAQLRPQAQQGEPIPDAVEDPLGYTQWAITQLARQNEQLSQWQQGQALQQQQAVQMQQLSGWVTQQEGEFEKEHPDYAKAYEHIVKIRRSELKAMGFNSQQQDAAIIQDAQLVASQAIQVGKNPAEILWELAETRGYKTEKPDVATAAIAKITAGQAASGGLKGGSAQGKMTAEDLAKMPVKTPAQKSAFEKGWKEVYG